MFKHSILLVILLHLIWVPTTVLLAQTAVTETRFSDTTIAASNNTAATAPNVAPKARRKVTQGSKEGEGDGRIVKNGIAVPATGTSTGPVADGDTPIGKRSVKFGVGLGASGYLKDVYSYALTAPNYSLATEKISSIAGVFSGVVIFNKSIYYYHGEDASTEPYARTYPLSALLAVNLATFAASATSTAAGFNTRLDLGIGFGYRFDDNFQIGLMLDFASLRFLREAYNQYEGKPVPTYTAAITTPASGTIPATTTIQNLTALDPTDDHYFINRTVPSISLKFIYNLTPEQPSKKATEETAAFLAK